MFNETQASTPSKADEDRAGRPSPPEGDPSRPSAAAIVVAGEAEVAAQLERHLARCRRQRSVLALVCVGVERIERAAGDLQADLERQVHDEVAHRMRARVRSTDRVMRESDLRACVVLPGGTDDAARRVADRLARALNGPYRVRGQLVQVTVRVGYAAHPRDGALGADLLLKAAERGNG